MWYRVLEFKVGWDGAACTFVAKRHRGSRRPWLRPRQQVRCCCCLVSYPQLPPSIGSQFPSCWLGERTLQTRSSLRARIPRYRLHICFSGRHALGISNDGAGPRHIHLRRSGLAPSTVKGEDFASGVRRTSIQICKPFSMLCVVSRSQQLFHEQAVPSCLHSGADPDLQRLSFL